MLPHNLYYLQNNSNIPFGLVTTTARKGTKWFHQAKVGDPVDIKITETEECIGRAVVVSVTALSYSDVLKEANTNHVASGAKVAAGRNPADVLADELRAAYGQSGPYDIFTVLGIVRVN